MPAQVREDLTPFVEALLEGQILTRMEEVLVPLTFVRVVDDKREYDDRGEDDRDD